jgi:hypothetical protein
VNNVFHAKVTPTWTLVFHYMNAKNQLVKAHSMSQKKELALNAVPIILSTRIILGIASVIAITMKITIRTLILMNAPKTLVQAQTLKPLMVHVVNVIVVQALSISLLLIVHAMTAGTIKLLIL